MDAGETIAFARELESVRAQIVEQEFPAYRARDYVTVVPGVDPGAESFTWYQFKRVGLARMIANYADDLPNISQYGIKNSTPIHGIGLSYSYSTQDIRRAAMMKRPLEARLGIQARSEIERKIDEVCAIGDAGRNITGMINSTSVPLVTVGFTGGWHTATAQEIVDDLNLMAITVWRQSKTVHVPDTILLSTDAYGIISTKVYSEFTGKTVLAVFLESQKMIKRVDSWVYLDLAAANGTDDRAICYQSGSSNVEAIVPLEYSQEPPQAQDLKFKIPVEARVGGVVWYLPFSAVYCDLFT